MSRLLKQDTLAHTVIRFGNDRRGNIAIMTALLAIPLIGISGLAIDHSIKSAAKIKLDQAADAAALAGATAAAQQIRGGTTQSAALSNGRAIALQAFAANAGKNFATDNPAPSAQLALNNNVVTATISYSAPGNLLFGSLFGSQTATVGGKSSATMALPSYINVYLMVDTSGSMSIGASSADQQALISQIGCAFACHDGNKVKGYADAYTYAEAKGIPLRYDVMNSGIKNFLTTVDATDPIHQYIQSTIYTFDSALHQPVKLTSNTTTIRQNLPSAPATAGQYDGATHFNEAIPSVMNDIGSGGDGLSPGNPKKLVIIATDGVQDPNRTWTTNVPLRSQVTLINTSFCATLANRNVTLAFIHMPYLPMTWDWGYNATLGQPATAGTAGTRVDMIQPALKKCAGPFYALANDSTSLNNAFASIFQSYVGIRLSN